VKIQKRLFSGPKGPNQGFITEWSHHHQEQVSISTGFSGPSSAI